jgi:glycosyltransferase involved in cell wall biosynthesis
MKLTVLICTHDRRALLARTVGFLKAARRSAGWAVEVLVMANACTDDIEDWLSAYGRLHPEGLPLRFATEPRPGKARALNNALGRLDGGRWSPSSMTTTGAMRAISRRCTRRPRPGPRQTSSAGASCPTRTGRSPHGCMTGGRATVIPPPLSRAVFWLRVDPIRPLTLIAGLALGAQRYLAQVCHYGA